MPALYANNVAAVTATDIGPSDTVVLLSAGQGVAFPQPTAGQWFWATLIHPVSHVVEVVQCTARSADSLTVVRGRDSTTATAFPAGSVMEMRLVAQMMREANWQLVANMVNGIPALGGDGKVAPAQLPTSIPYMVDSLIPIGLLPAELLTETEGNAAYGRKDAANTWAEGQTLNKTLNVLGRVSVGDLSGNDAVIDIGNDAQLRDVGRANTIGIVGAQDNTKAELQFGIPPGGGGGLLIWNPGAGNFQIAPPSQSAYGIWHGGNFDPNTKAPNQDPHLFSPRIFRTGFGTNHGIVYWGEQDSYILYDGSNFTCSNNFYAPNLIGTSDANLKKNIRPRKAVSHIGDHIQLQSWEWRRKGNPEAPKGRQNGVIAQQVQKYAPHHVSERGDGVLGVDKAGLALEVGVDNAARCRKLEAQVKELREQVRQLTKKPR